MGTILGTKLAKDNKIIHEIEFDYLEHLQLKGHVKNIRLFSDDVVNTKANLSQRGKNGATKYFLIPRELRTNLKFNGEVKCQKIDLDKKLMFIYVVDKINIDKPNSKDKE